MAVRVPKAIQEQFDVNVQFIQFKGVHEICNFLGFEQSRNVILWYIGCYGLKKSCVDFYRRELILPLLLKECFTKFWLVDLTAWFGLKDKRGSILKDSRISKDIEKIESSYFEVIKSSETLQKIKNFSCEPLVNILRKSMKSGFVSNNSASYCRSGIPVRDIFGENSPLMQPFSEEDTGKFYSALQYVEGCFIIQTILERTLCKPMADSQKRVDIQFVLPNDEYKYYFDLHSTFQKDAHYIVAHTCRLLGVDSLSVNIEFLTYPFGDDSSKRPYNGIRGDKSLKHLDLSDLAGLNKLEI